MEGIFAPGISDQRQRNRRDLLHSLDSLGKAMPGNPHFELLDRCEEKADAILGDAGKLFDLSQEKDELRDRYGRNTFGQSCLMARRLVERGVPYVTINYGGWDTHKQNFETMRRKLPEMDKGMATLLQDLADRGLLDSTIVWWGGEFGRTPKIEWEAALERRPGPLGQLLLRRGRRRRVQGRPRRRRLRRERRVRGGTSRVSAGPASAASTNCSASTPTARCRTRGD